MAPPLREMTISPLDGGLMLREDHSRKTVDLLGFMPDVSPPSWRVLCFHGESQIRLPVASIPLAIQDVNVRPRMRAISVSISWAICRASVICWASFLAQWNQAPEALVRYRAQQRG
jgi:hypothetical protein